MIFEDNFILDFLVLVAGLIVIIYIIGLIIQDIRINREEKRLIELLSQAGIEEVDRMDGVEFEHFLEVLFNKLGYRVQRTPASNDFGADLILDERAGERIVIQAKRYGSKVGVSAVQEINAAKGYYHAQEAWVITNNLFTTPAMKLAEANHIKMMDRYELADLILLTKENLQSPKNTNSNKRNVEKTENKVRTLIYLLIFLGIFILVGLFI